MKGKCSFGVRDFINMQCNGKKRAPDRDLEMVRLRCQLEYMTDFGFEGPAPFFACKFCPKPSYNNIVASADEVGFVSLHNIDKFKSIVSYKKTHDNAVFDLAWVPNDSKFLTLSGDHTAKLWDCGQGDIQLIYTFRGHFKSIKTADFRPTDPATFATGSRDGTVLLWDLRCKNKMACSCQNVFTYDQIIHHAAIDQPKITKKPSYASVTSVIFQDDYNLLCAGSNDPYIRVWDMRKTYTENRISEPKAKFKAQKSGFSDLKLNPERTKLYANCLNSSIYAFNLNTYDPAPIAEFSGHEPASFYVKSSVSADGQYLISGSTDKIVYIWKTKDAELSDIHCHPFRALIGHHAEVTGVDINQNGFTTVVSSSDDGTLRLWRPDFSVNSMDSPILTADFSNLKIQDSTVTSTLEPGFSVHYDWCEDCAKSEMKITHPSLRTPISKTARDSVVGATVKRKLRETSPSYEESSASKRAILSPTKSNNSGQNYVSPTVNLPNYVIDGTGPHHRCPRSRQKENIDWLTQIRQSSTHRSEELGVNQPSSSEKKYSSSRSRKFESRAGSSRTPTRRTLLSYYKKCSKGSE